MGPRAELVVVREEGEQQVVRPLGSARRGGGRCVRRGGGGGRPTRMHAGVSDAPQRGRGSGGGGDNSVVRGAQGDGWLARRARYRGGGGITV